MASIKKAVSILTAFFMGGDMLFNIEIKDCEEDIFKNNSSFAFSAVALPTSADALVIAADAFTTSAIALAFSKSPWQLRLMPTLLRLLPW